ncbi:MAG: DUF2270 domain-containing protein [Pseudomonadota bacterium]
MPDTFDDLDANEPPIAEPLAGSKEIGALAHLYRGEVYRSTIWRQRLDTTTNWAVLTTGVALSITFATSESSPLPMVLSGLLTVMFLILEARRYQYFNVWRFRARILEIAVYVPLLRGEGAKIPVDRGAALSDDYLEPKMRISFPRAVGRRLRRNYGYLFGVQGIAYFSKIAIHPEEVTSLVEFVDRAHVGPIPGWLAFAVGLAFHSTWILIAWLTYMDEKSDMSVVADVLD